MRAQRYSEEPPAGFRVTYAAAPALALLIGLVLLPITAHAGSEEQELRCLALTIYHEARGESEAGRLAVGHVVMNRTHNGNFPAGVCDVVQQGGEQLHQCQFSWWCDGRSDVPRDLQALRESLTLAQAIYHGCTADPTGGALWFHTTAVKPSWSASSGPGQRIGQHVFYRGESGWIARASVTGPRGRVEQPVGRSNACLQQHPRDRARSLVASG
jgi:spore germination cell wall hydrolase CwlJ-like protein